MNHLGALMCLAIASGPVAGAHSASTADPQSGSQLENLAAGVEQGFDEGFGTVYREHCAVCHGVEMLGSPQGPALIGVELGAGAGVHDLGASISKGMPDEGMPAWQGVLTDQEIHNLAVYVAERREGLSYKSYHDLAKLNVASDTTSSLLHDIEMEIVTQGLDPLVYSIEPLPDGRILVTERTKGLSVVEPAGGITTISGIPRIFDDVQGQGLAAVGLGQILEVKAHPEYMKNGWIYLSLGDRCSGCNAQSKALGQDVSMVRVIRGRIAGARWVDQEEVWSVDKTFYTVVPDTPAAARLAFDEQNHLFISIGMQAVPLQAGIQDLSTPYGKIHRVRDDGEIPEDNPFRQTKEALRSIWSLGHRTPQGLEFDFANRELWVAEMGPRGGDELNLIEPGSNYGWPLVSKGVNYDGTKVDYGAQFGIRFDPAALTAPELDFTPALALSSFIVYGGEVFPEWRDDFILATLKAMKLIRVRRTDNGGFEQEILLNDIARIRDIEEDADGNILLLLEHIGGSVIVRLSSPR